MKERKSNIELLRIILMILIVAHHYVVNSGITDLFDFKNITFNMIFLQFFGYAGKIGINCFVLITGYFMVKSKITLKKFLKLYLEVKFYAIVIYMIFMVTGYEKFSITGLAKTLFSVVFYAGKGFTSTYIIFFLLIPFINILLNNFNKRKHVTLILLLTFYFTIISTFSIKNNTWNYVGWLITVYIIGAYIRLYPNKYLKSIKINSILFMIITIISFASILCVDYIGSKFGFYDYYYFVNDAHKLLAILSAVTLFLVFTNLDIKNIKVINIISRSTFGVLLIHTSSETMRRWLWKDLFMNTEYYNSEYLILHAILATFIVYIVCNLIDQFRIIIFEKRIFDKNDKKFNEMQNKIEKYFETKIGEENGITNIK